MKKNIILLIFFIKISTKLLNAYDLDENLSIRYNDHVKKKYIYNNIKHSQPHLFADEINNIIDNKENLYIDINNDTLYIAEYSRAKEEGSVVKKKIDYESMYITLPKTKINCDFLSKSKFFNNFQIIDKYNRTQNISIKDKINFPYRKILYKNYFDIRPSNNSYFNYNYDIGKLFFKANIVADNGKRSINQENISIENKDQNIRSIILGMNTFLLQKNIHINVGYLRNKYQNSNLDKDHKQILSLLSNNLFTDTINDNKYHWHSNLGYKHNNNLHYYFNYSYNKNSNNHYFTNESIYRINNFNIFTKAGYLYEKNGPIGMNGQDVLDTSGKYKTYFISNSIEKKIGNVRFLLNKTSGETKSDSNNNNYININTIKTIQWEADIVKYNILNNRDEFTIRYILPYKITKGSFSINYPEYIENTRQTVIQHETLETYSPMLSEDRLIDIDKIIELKYLYRAKQKSQILLGYRGIIDRSIRNKIFFINLNKNL